MQTKLFIENKKDIKLATIIQRPEDEGTVPVVFLLLGLIGYKEAIRSEILATELEKCGIGVVRFDTSGFGESEGSIELDYRFSNYISDTQAVFEYITALKWADKKRIGVCGESMAGIQALICAKNNPQIKAVAVSSAPTIMGSSDDLKGKYAEWKKTGYLERVSSRYGKLRIPFAFIEDACQFDALTYVPFIKQSLLVTYGTDDINVPNQITKKIYDAALGKKELWVLEGADHFLNRDPIVMQKFAKKVADFFKAELN